MTYYGINKLIDSMERKIIFMVSLFQVCEINTNLSLFIGLLDQHHIGQPHWIIYVLYEPSLEKLVNLDLNGLITFWTEDIFAST